MKSRVSSTVLTRSVASTPVKIYLAIAYAYFLSGADNYIFQFSKVRIPPNLALVMFFVPLAAVLLTKDFMRSKPLSGVFTQFRVNLPVVGAFFSLVLISLLLSLHDTANWRNDGKWIKIVTVDFAVFLLGMSLPVLDVIRHSYRRCIIAGIIVLAASIGYDMLFPGALFTSRDRAAGFAINPNLGGLLLAMMAASTLGYEATTRRRDNWILAITGLGIFATLSRGGVLLYLLLLGFYLYATLFASKGGFKKSLMVLLSAGILLAFIKFMIPLMMEQSGMFKEKNAQNRVNSLMGDRGLYSEDDGRLRAVHQSLRLINEAPFVGHGTGFTQTMTVGPHNMYLKQWVDNGLPGLLGYVFLLLSGFWLFYKRKFFPGQAFLAVVLLGGLFSHNILDLRAFLILFGTLLSASWYGMSVAADEGELWLLTRGDPQDMTFPGGASTPSGAAIGASAAFSSYTNARTL